MTMNRRSVITAGLAGVAAVGAHIVSRAQTQTPARQARMSGPLFFDVETTNGVVTLSGNVKTKAEEDKALSIAHASKGVRRVVNHMKVAA